MVPLRQGKLLQQYGLLWLDGGFAEYAVVRTNNVFPVNNPAITTFVEPLLVALHAAAKIKRNLRGCKALVLGAGAIGIAMAPVLTFVHEAEVSITNILSKRRQRAKAAAFHVIEKAALFKRFDIVIDCAGSNPYSKESGNQAAAVVADLLTVARGVASVREIADLNSLINEYLTSAEHIKIKTLNPSIVVKFESAPDLHNISCSSIHIKKALMNLVVNAFEAIEGSGTVVISTKNRYIDTPLKKIWIGEYVVLSVSDDGSGILPNDLEKIFDPFYTKKVMGRSGTGLGLTLVWNTLHDHGGHINVKSDEKGTVFELYFPAVREATSETKEELELAHLKGNGESILVVDDEQTQGEIACHVLNLLGYERKAVASGEEAVEYVKEQAVDLLLLDMIMEPGINGRETYEKIIKIHPGQKAVIASGWAESDEVRKAMELGVARYIRKPYTLAQIGQVIKEALEV